MKTKYFVSSTDAETSCRGLKSIPYGVLYKGLSFLVPFPLPSAALFHFGSWMPSLAVHEIPVIWYAVLAHCSYLTSTLRVSKLAYCVRACRRPCECVRSAVDAAFLTVSLRAFVVLRCGRDVEAAAQSVVPAQSLPLGQNIRNLVMAEI